MPPHDRQPSVPKELEHHNAACILDECNIESGVAQQQGWGWVGDVTCQEDKGGDDNRQEDKGGDDNRHGLLIAEQDQHQWDSSQEVMEPANDAQHVSIRFGVDKR